jgi:hypothetical protein
MHIKNDKLLKYSEEFFFRSEYENKALEPEEKKTVYMKRRFVEAGGVVERFIKLRVCRQRTVSCLRRLMAVELKCKLKQKAVPLSVDTDGACSLPCSKNQENISTARTLK